MDEEEGCEEPLTSPRVLSTRIKLLKARVKVPGVDQSLSLDWDSSRQRA